MDAAAFASLYDRYERPVYNLCYRITGSRDDAADATQETFLKILERLPKLDGRELNFGAYVMTAARNASYDALERRTRSAPAGEMPDTADADDPDVPERAALREAHQEQIRAANRMLPPRQREVLALRELQDLSYGEVAEIMGMNQNSVAQLISRARINLRDGLRQTALGSVASASPNCDRALPLLAARQDGLGEEPWLAAHLMECGTCRVRLEAMEEASVAYRQWLLLAPAVWLREEIAAAAERTGARTHRGGRRLAAAGATLVVVLLALADGAETPTRVFVPAAEPVTGVTSAPPAPRQRRSRPKPKPKPPRAEKAVRREPPAPEVGEPVLAAASIRPAATPEAVAPKRRVRPPREPRPQAEPAVVAEPVVVSESPPPVEEPPVVEEPVTPVDTPPTDPCAGTSVAGCPPPPRPVTCTSCGLVAQPPDPPVVAVPRRR
jgi:RNA polymerase sigma factor (sigma-70 family)